MIGFDVSTDVQTLQFTIQWSFHFIVVIFGLFFLLVSISCSCLFLFRCWKWLHSVDFDWCVEYTLRRKRFANETHSATKESFDIGIELECTERSITISGVVPFFCCDAILSRWRYIVAFAGNLFHMLQLPHTVIYQWALNDRNKKEGAWERKKHKHTDTSIQYRYILLIQIWDSWNACCMWLLKWNNKQFHVEISLHFFSMRVVTWNEIGFVDLYDCYCFASRKKVTKNQIIRDRLHGAHWIATTANLVAVDVVVVVVMREIKTKQPNRISNFQIDFFI